MRLKTIVWYMIVVIVTMAFTNLFYGCSIDGNDKSKLFEGKWSRIDDSSHVVVMEIQDSLKYLYHVAEENTFDGKITLRGDTIVFVDKYCGTSLPGKYLYKFTDSTNNIISFSLIDDKYCGRKEVLPTKEWAKFN